MRTALTHRSYLNEHPDLDWEDTNAWSTWGMRSSTSCWPTICIGACGRLGGGIDRDSGIAGAQRYVGPFCAPIWLGGLLFMGHGEADSGGRERPATLCGAFEALAGASTRSGPDRREEAGAASGGARTRSGSRAVRPRRPSLLSDWGASDSVTARNTGGFSRVIAYTRKIPRAVCRSGRRACWGSRHTIARSGPRGRSCEDVHDRGPDR